MSVDAGLVLEGGGMRGVYTAGVLEYFLEKEISFPYVIGVSAGAAMAASYLSKQKGRNKRVNIELVKDPRYLSWRNYFKNRQLFGMDFIFDEIPNKLVPFDYDEFFKSKSQFVIGTTDCLTGEPVYLTKEDYGEEMLKAIKASSSLPFIAPEIHFKNRILLDGGISDPIPLGKSQKDGNKRNVVILTRNEGYLKKPSKFHFLVKRKYPEYTGLQRALADRYRKYNETVEYLREEEKKGNTVVIRPAKPLDVGRIERNPVKLENLYVQGYQDAKLAAERLAAW
ncbi:patatin-like phospholipase family protein [Mesobacillus foraminis]|uniref:Putative patatin/cPLA2 family phospholipase n=1 Tax=Mesobacillus foraminis TaxID=279826 RepID=A0A4R2BD53_9BACI|nr:patatin family protein [Mesobacillus foraminis]TCN24867.1 putative patatin/cPLA2 family phospholipase [Mesobacillus foraminis]